MNCVSWFPIFFTVLCWDLLSSFSLYLYQVRGSKGPIFEDGPNFDMAFRLFHGQDGVVPLSGRSFVQNEKIEPEPASAQFNPLAAKAATISLSGFGLGGPFGFDAFSKKWNNQKKNSKSSKKDSSSKVHSRYFYVIFCSHSPS